MTNNERELLIEVINYGTTFHWKALENIYKQNGHQIPHIPFTPTSDTGVKDMMDAAKIAQEILTKEIGNVSVVFNIVHECKETQHDIKECSIAEALDTIKEYLETGHDIIHVSMIQNY